MALNCSSCSVLPAESCGSGCDSKSREVPFSSGGEIGNAYWYGGWDSLELPCLSDWDIDNIFGYGGVEAEYLKWDAGYEYDPILRLPDDPFEQNGSFDITTAAIAAGLMRIGATSGCHRFNDSDFVASYCWDEAMLYSSETDFSKGCSPGGYLDQTFSALSVNGTQDRVFKSVLDMEQLPETSGDEGSNAHAVGLPHEAFTFALGYLGVKDLLSVEGVCKSLRLTVQSDSLLWRCIHIDSSLSEKITDDALWQLTQRAQGNLQCLSLTGCSRITDEGLRRVLENNPRLRKLSVPECVRLTLDGLINNLKSFQSGGTQGIKYLKLGRLFSVSEDQFGELKNLLGLDEVEQDKIQRPQFYHIGRSSLTCHDEYSIDIDICPLCQKYKLVYDCPSDSCQAKGSQQCRACDVCITRCIQCGKCIKDSKYVETFFLEYLCSGCWKNPSIGPETNKDTKE